jgi:hypothetical protein
MTDSGVAAAGIKLMNAEIRPIPNPNPLPRIHRCTHSATLPYSDEGYRKKDLMEAT